MATATPMLDDEWIELACHLEWLAQMIRDTVDDDSRQWPTTASLRGRFGTKETHALIAAAVACGVKEHRS